MTSVQNEDLFLKVVQSYIEEFIKSMKVETNEGKNLMINYSDLHVWYFNRDCQHALPEIKKIWEQVPSSPLGTKSLESFFTVMARTLFKTHSELVRKIKISEEIVRVRKKKILESTDEVIKAANSCCFNGKDSEQEFLTFQTNSSYTKECDLHPEFLTVALNLHFAELSDLCMAFDEGFEGFSMKITNGHEYFETHRVDVDRNQAIWNSDFQFKLNSKELTVRVELLQHFKGKSLEIAHVDLDVLRYVLGSKQNEKFWVEDGLVALGGRERYEVMDQGTMSEPPKIGFTVTAFVATLDNLKNWLCSRKKFVENAFKKKAQDVDCINIQLAQITAGFKTVYSDTTRVYTVSQPEDGCGLCCPKGKKNKRSCLVF